MASFKKTFAAAREKLGAGKTFMWNGKRYTTNLASESSAPKKSQKPKSRSTPKSKGVSTPKVTTTKLEPHGSIGVDAIKKKAKGAIKKAEAGASTPPKQKGTKALPTGQKGVRWPGVKGTYAGGRKSTPTKKKTSSKPAGWRGSKVKDKKS